MLAKRYRYTWEETEINQIWTLNQAIQHDWLKETQKKCPINVIQTTMRARLLLQLHLCVSPHVKVKMKLFRHVQLFVTLMGCSLPGSSIHGIFQDRVLEWVVIGFSRGSS